MFAPRIPRILMLAALPVILAVDPAAGQMDWQLVAADYPRCRSDHAMAGDTVRKRIVLFGGYGMLGDTWEWDGTKWNYLIPPVSPPGRTGHAMAYDAARRQVVLFGGWTGTGSVSDTWTWDGTTWTLHTPPVSPQGRGGHGLAYDAARKRVVLFGGMAGTGRNAVLLGDTWEWDGAKWTRRSPANSPPATYDHAMAYDALRQRVVLFATGGFWNASNDTWEWDGNNWTRRSPATLPPPRYAHTIEYDATTRRVLLFGGIGGTIANPTTLNDTWLWDGVSWAQQQPSVIPTSNAGNEMAYDTASGKLLSHGGYYSNDSWAWDGWTWTRIPATAGKPPSRYAHAIADDPVRQRVVLFGGRNQSTVFNDTWTWDGARWTAALPATKPPARHAHAMAFDAFRKRVVLFGGMNGSALQDTWEWDGIDWTRMTPVTSPPARELHTMVYDVSRRQVLLFGGQDSGLLGDTWTWDGKNWTLHKPAASPSPRNGHGMAYDLARQRVVLFGGDAGWAMADTWEWDGKDWTHLQPSTSPLYRWQHAMAYDAARQRTVVFGGWQHDRIPHSKPFYYSDTWEWDGTNWRQQNPSSQPTPSFSFQPMTYDHTRGRLILAYTNDLETWTYTPQDLTASTPVISATTGGNVILSLDAGSTHAGKGYIIAGCMDGPMARGIRLGASTLLLKQDAYFWLTVANPGPLIVNAHGLLDTSGKAIAAIRVPRGLPAGFIGARFYHAYLVYGSRIDYTSTPVPLTIGP